MALTQGAAWLIGLVTGFLLPPPFDGDDDVTTWLRFAQFLSAVVLGLLLFVVLRCRQKRHARGWWMAAIGSLILATATFFCYQHLTSAWTTTYFGEVIVIGSEYTPHTQSYVAQNPGIPLRTLLEDFLGRAEDIWTRESIQRRRIILAGIYVGCVPLCTICVMAVIQALQCLAAGKHK